MFIKYINFDNVTRLFTNKTTGGRAIHDYVPTPVWVGTTALPISSADQQFLYCCVVDEGQGQPVQARETKDLKSLNRQHICNIEAILPRSCMSEQQLSIIALICKKSHAASHTDFSTCCCRTDRRHNSSVAQCQCLVISEIILR